MEGPLPDSLYQMVDAAFTLSIHPRYADDLMEGVVDSLTRMIFKYSKELSGIPVAFDDVRFVTAKHAISDCLGTISVDVSCRFLVFAPAEGDELVGEVTLVSSLHVAFLVQDTFHGTCNNIAEQLKVVKDAEGAMKFVDPRDEDIFVEVGTQIRVQIDRVEIVKHGIQLCCTFLGVA
ncbi:SHS2 domain found in N terminus of Rpb7p/Rpc25p/MJ0397 [Carpediemonas membranifera]|uniref:SHS2 domain found in N terminus of Rpb7p/Rpc25p/MJ0397 n=1 Tax=Carpediemonas membranifera TaxID=201153 RepID=A0A8J6B1V5_9EUKA|nr:SHS2 domain found in N terminus of Rpb7p/Rpc25p/MJ0397 [Carpediemonas membranifera]|eukprot:KAG9393933.1 SHS2 domain found in N terminus of Rpb7p/Rpc25p/MJ0397 [Carpediemonas membranifera]